MLLYCSEFISTSCEQVGSLSCVSVKRASMQAMSVQLRSVTLTYISISILGYWVPYILEYKSTNFGTVFARKSGVWLMCRS